MSYLHTDALGVTPAGRHLLQATGAGFSSSSTKETPASEAYTAYSPSPSGMPAAMRVFSVRGYQGSSPESSS